MPPETQQTRFSVGFEQYAPQKPHEPRRLHGPVNLPMLSPDYNSTSLEGLSGSAYEINFLLSEGSNTDRSCIFSLDPVLGWCMSAVSRSSKFVSALVHRCSHADCFGRAGEVAFFFALAFFPLLLVAMALVSAAAADAPDVRRALAMQLRYVLPGGAQLMVERTLREISRTASFGLVTTEVLTALWSASAAISALQNTLNDAYRVRETRSWIVAKLNALWLTTAVCVLVIAAMLLSMKLGGIFVQRSVEDATWWNVARWPLVILFVLLAVALVYRYAPARRDQRPWAWVTAGSLIAVAIWLTASLGVKAYLRHSSSFVAVYGSMTSVVALLLWFYISALALLLGAHVNAELTSAVPDISIKHAA